MERSPDQRAHGPRHDRDGPSSSETPSPTGPPPARLTARDRRVLDFEGSWWCYPEPKDQAIREYLGMSATRYYQILRRIVDDPAALAYAPLVIRRLRRLRRDRLAAINQRLEGSPEPTG